MAKVSSRRGPAIPGLSVKPHEFTWFRVQGSGFRVQGSGLRVVNLRFKVQGLRFRDYGVGFEV